MKQTMDAKEIIKYINESKKMTPVKVYLREKKPISFENCRVFGCGDKIVFGDWEDIKKALHTHADDIEDMLIENECRNSAIPLLDLKEINARIEPGAIIRDQVKIGEQAVVMMGAVINIGASIGEGTMIDMGAVLGGRAIVGKNCHIGAGSVLAG
ncbi:MAG: 2,3,4,5-tetrahydropyridine-2,6-dicarboxylate N-acetyltransferase, partial [Eubacteriales bacterium]|nr:2,3,4,5-tetrahydropyridine-2,6-dicarboxylate N-acetyltransferase [Eubacteriales bacterium]